MVETRKVRISTKGKKVVDLRPRRRQRKRMLKTTTKNNDKKIIIKNDQMGKHMDKKRNGIM